ncbi:hypothetical protein Dimus_023636 [Dionaea muscipula]
MAALSRPKREPASNPDVVRVAENKSALAMLKILLLVSLLLPVVLIGLTLASDYHVERGEAQERLKRISVVASAITERAFAEQARIAADVNTLLAEMPTADIMNNELQLHQMLQDKIAHVPEVDSIVVVTAGGMPLVSATIFPAPSNINLSGRTFFKATLATASGYFVSSVHPGAIMRQPVFGLGRRWTNNAGKVRGIISIIVSPRFFQSVFGGMIDDESIFGGGEILALLRTDGSELVRYQTSGDTLSVGAALFVAAAARTPAAGVFTVPGAAASNTGGLRYVAYQKVPGFPLYVVTGTTNADIIAAWRQAVFGHLAIGIPVTLLLVALSWIAFFRGRREEAALARAQTAMEAREKAEQTLLRAQRLEAVGQLTGGVAHDFNNLLTVIIGCTELLDRRANSAQAVQRLAANIKTAAERGADITAKLLAFSRRQAIKPEWIDINRNLLDFAPLLRRAVNERVAILLDLAPDGCPVLLDPGQFEAAMLNLVGNARDAMPEGGRIVIGTRNDANLGEFADMPLGPILRVSVRDTGTGMDAVTAARAVEPFFTTKGIGRGTGLGLSQVYGFVKQSGGEFRIETVPGEGTSIELILPGTSLPRAPGPGEAAAARPHHTENAGQVVLVAEDEVSVRDVAVETLSQLGFTVLDATDAEQALLHLRTQGQIDLLFSDVIMSGAMNGLELAEMAQRLRPGIRILLTSGYNAVAETARLRFPLLLKPYDPMQLVSLIRAVLSQQTTAEGDERDDATASVTVPSSIRPETEEQPRTDTTTGGDPVFFVAGWD